MAEAVRRFQQNVNSAAELVTGHGRHSAHAAADPLARLPSTTQWQAPLWGNALWGRAKTHRRSTSADAQVRVCAYLRSGGGTRARLPACLPCVPAPAPPACSTAASPWRCVCSRA